MQASAGTTVNQGRGCGLKSGCVWCKVMIHLHFCSNKEIQEVAVKHQEEVEHACVCMCMGVSSNLHDSAYFKLKFPQNTNHTKKLNALTVHVCIGEES